MNQPDPSDRGPAGPLGRAFANLAADAPPTHLSAAGVIATAHRESHRRHRWVLGTGVAAAAVAVTTLIGVSVSQTGGSNDASTAAVQSSAASSVSAPALASSPPGEPGGAAGGGSGAPGDQGSDSDAQTQPEAAPTSGDCDPGLSGPQEAAVLDALPGLMAAAECPATSESALAASEFTGAGVTVTVVIAAGEGGCPSDEQSDCATVDGHPDVLVLATPKDRPVNGGTSTTVIAADGGRTATITVERDGATGELPYPVDDLATIAETLLGG